MEPVTTNLIGRPAYVDGDESVPASMIAAVVWSDGRFVCLLITHEAQLVEIDAKRLVVGDDE
jgi:hypothetical protein